MKAISAEDHSRYDFPTCLMKINRTMVYFLLKALDNTFSESEQLQK
jgi:hypothetical protein